MAYTSADLTAVQTARLRGIRTVQFADRQVTYSSDAELRQVEQDIKTELAQTSGTRRAKQVYAYGSSGF